MNTLIPWIALLIAGTALVAALVPSTPPATASKTGTTAIGATDAAVITRLQAELTTLRAEVAALRDRPASSVDAVAVAPTVDDERLRELVRETVRAERARTPEAGGAPAGGPPWAQPGPVIDTAAATTQLAERFALEPAQASELVTAATELQTTMRAAFTAGGDREQAFATIRTAREAFEAKVAAAIPADRHDDFRRFASEQLGLRGRGGPRGERGERPPRGEDANAPAPPAGVQEF